MPDLDTLVYPRTDQRLGRVKRHDPRSRGFDLAQTLSPRLPTERIEWARTGPLFDQDIGCCTACAALGLLMTEPFTNGQTYTLDDAHALYHEETVIDGFRGVWPPDDTGSSGLAAMKALKRRGLIAGYRHAFSPTVAVAALARGPIAVGTVWLESMFRPVGGRIIVDPRSPVAGGHDYLVTAWDPAPRRVRVTNSWGDWGIAGEAWMDLDSFAWLLRNGGDAVQPVMPT